MADIAILGLADELPKIAAKLERGAACGVLSSLLRMHGKNLIPINKRYPRLGRGDVSHRAWGSSPFYRKRLLSGGFFSCPAARNPDINIQIGDVRVKCITRLALYNDIVPDSIVQFCLERFDYCWIGVGCIRGCRMACGVTSSGLPGPHSL